MKHMKKLTLILLTLGLITVFLVVFILTSGNQGESPLTDEPAVSEPEVEEEEPEPEPDPIYHPLTGLEVGEEVSARMLMVSVDNNPDARPQYGVSDADLIYELPAEGGIPRLLVCFYGSSSEKVGPVRSARPYFINMVQGWDGLFAHCGWSPAAQTLLYSGVVDYVNEIAQTPYFWRASDRYAPHNLFTSTDLLYEYLEDHDLATTQEIEGFTFLAEGEESEGSLADRVEIKYRWADNIYVYDASRNDYARYIGEDAYIDGATGEQLHVSNIVMQRVKSYVYDSYGRLSIDMCEGGDALLFTGGKVVEGYWTRNSLEENTHYYDKEGNEFVFTPGLTWIQVCDGDVEVNYLDSTAVVEDNSVAE